MVDNIRKGLSGIYRRLNALTGGALTVVVESIQYFNLNRGPEAAAVVSYYSLFSIFPLLIFIVAGLSFILGVQAAQEQVTQQIQNILPVSTEIITQNIQSVLRQRTSFSLVGLLGLFWAATGMFNTLALNINRAFPQANARSFFHNRFIAILLVSGIVSLIFISLAFTTILDVLRLEKSPILDFISSSIQNSYHILAQFGPFLIRLVAVWTLYRFVPNTRIRTVPAFIGALITAMAWELSTRAFTWYLSSGYTTYEVIYGSLGRIFALLIWLYISSWLLIFGAYLTAAITQLFKGKPYFSIPDLNNNNNR